jgi:hypothetical protein
MAETIKAAVATVEREKRMFYGFSGKFFEVKVGMKFEE